MLVSVVIVTRNRSDFLLRCLQSVAMQDYKEVETIVVDNASSDDMAKTVASHYPSVTVLRQTHNTGAPEGRNIGMRQAKGALCICLDDDAELLSGSAIRECIEHFTQDPQLGCLSMRVFDQHGKIVTKLIPRRDRKVITEDTPGAMFSATGCAIRRSAFFEAGEFWQDLSPYFGEEPELGYRLLDKGYTILHTPHIAVKHYETPLERPKGRRVFYGTRNTPWIAMRNLPWYSVVSLTLLSWGYFFVMAIAENHIPEFFKAVAASIRHMPAVYRIRKPINADTRRILWKYSGLIIW